MPYAVDSMPSFLRAVLVILIYVADVSVFGWIILHALRSANRRLLGQGVAWVVMIAIGATSFMISAVQRGFFV
ncbi:hypothetical protein [Sinomonas susongensis]|uniref:hypothetical protein n=1 Tax=Sinomonas susongensis TaxID=1324851 RepID=UPI001109A9EA|nr:hypothetical protein [Sinomonas susongensis]